MKRFALLISLLTLAASPGLATTMVLGTDEELFDQAAVIAEGTVLSVRPDPSGRPATEYRVRVERTLKGRTPGGDLTVRVPGGVGADGWRLTVWGAPELRADERTLLFLGQYGDGAYGPLHLALGAFHELRDGGRKLAVRDLSEMADVSSGEAAPARDGVREFRRFADWLADRAAGLRRPADYFVDGPASGLRPIQEKFNYLGGIRQRWLEFDRGASVGWRAHNGGQPGLASGGVPEFQTAMQAWNGDAATNIRYRYDGTTTASRGFRSFDGVNAILFEDPNGEVSGTFTCSSPGRGFGTLALGGTWTAAGPEPRPIAGGDIIVNDGAGCWFNTSKRAEQVYGHELGHTLGLGHSCGDARTGECSDPLAAEALMRATAFTDERGARLNEDDRDGVLSLYAGDGGGGTSDKPAAPANLTAAALSTTTIQLAWTDNATNETSYQVESKTTGSFKVAASLPADATGTTLAGLTPGTTYTFRVRARNSAGDSAYSNQASAATPATGPPQAPSNLTAILASPGQIQLAWEDNAANETGFRIERSSPATGWTFLASVPADTETFTVPAGADTPYTFRVQASGAAGNSAFSNEASLTAPSAASGPCAAGAESLCLLSGRFRVSVQWRRPEGIHGTGKAVPNSNQTGLFWFFDASNIELIVKMIDARPAFPNFWVYYGGLSDVEYWITVVDTQTGATRTYHNEQGSLCGRGDVAAFPAAASLATAAPANAPEDGLRPTTDAVCAPGTLCLFGGRFQVEVSWKANGGQGVGTPVPLAGTDQSGMFWFFNSENIELVVKVIDARTLNGKFWFYYGALSDVEYDILVTDTTTEETQVYRNAPGNLCGRGDVDAFSP